jgi:hypothetical protein
MEEGQQAMRGVLPGEFKLRRPVFITRLVKIENADRARKDRLIGRMGIQGKGADLLTKFEKGGIKRPVAGGKSIAVPVEARRTASDILKGSQRPRALLRTPGSRAFKLVTKRGELLILQRYGRKRKSRTRLLFRLAPSAKVLARLNFLKTVDPVLRARLAINFHGFLVSAIRSAKP